MRLKTGHEHAAGDISGNFRKIPMGGILRSPMCKNRTVFGKAWRSSGRVNIRNLKFVYSVSFNLANGESPRALIPFARQSLPIFLARSSAKIGIRRQSPSARGIMKNTDAASGHTASGDAHTSLRCAPKSPIIDSSVECKMLSAFLYLRRRI